MYTCITYILYVHMYTYVTYVCGIQKSGTDELTCRDSDTQVENKCTDTKKRWQWDELGDWD